MDVSPADFTFQTVPVTFANGQATIASVPMASAFPNMIANADYTFGWSIQFSGDSTFQPMESTQHQIFLTHGAAYTFDQNGNTTGQMAGPLTYSWLGNAYQTGSTDLVAAMGLDFALSFGAFAGGSASANGTAVKFVQSKMFLPVGLTENKGDGADAFYFDWVKQNLKSTEVANNLLAYQKATEPAFKTALAITNTIVAFIGHAQPTANNGNAVGLCFAWNWCIVPTPLTEVTTSDGMPAVLQPPPGVQWDLLDNGFTPKAKVVFLAACGIDDNFIAQWHLQPGQAVIVPHNLSTSEFMHIDLFKAAWEWQSILLTLAQGKTVDEAVAAGNTTAASNGAAHLWQVIGNGNVNFRARLQ